MRLGAFLLLLRNPGSGFSPLYGQEGLHSPAPTQWTWFPFPSLWGKQTPLHHCLFPLGSQQAHIPSSALLWAPRDCSLLSGWNHPVEGTSVKAAGGRKGRLRYLFSLTLAATAPGPAGAASDGGSDKPALSLGSSPHWPAVSFPFPHSFRLRRVMASHCDWSLGAYNSVPVLGH